MYEVYHETMTTVFMMAQGQQQRIGHVLGVNGLPAWKQLLKVSETESIMARSCRLFLEAGADTVIQVIHWHHELVNACMDQVLPFLVQRDPGPSVLSGIYNVRHLWGERTVIALGDVVYSKDTVWRMISDKSFAMYERQKGNDTTGKPFSERFGLTFSREYHRDLLQVLEDRGFRQHMDSKLCDLRDRLGPISGAFVVRDVNDYTDDVDTAEGLVKFLPLLREAVARDI